MIRPVKPTDGDQIAEIYNHYITETTVTFEEETVTGDDIRQRVANVDGQGFPWIVYETEGVVVGYAYATKWRTRVAYRFTVECAVYVCKDRHGGGVGTQLYQFLFGELKKQGIHTIMAGISLPNEKSTRLHERLGFQKNGVNKQVGRKFDRWLDVGWWQLMLDDATA